MKTYEVVVDWNDIRKGKRHCAFTNPLVKAIDRAILADNPERGVTSVTVGSAQYGIRNTLYRLPDQLRLWLAAFDRGDLVGPIKFQFSY